MTRILADARHGLRLMMRSKIVTLTAIAALALAIGANTAMFSVVDAVLLRPLPFTDADRLVMVWEDASRVGFPRNTPAPANWVDWRKENTVFTDIAATRSAAFALTGDGQPDRVRGQRVTANFWTLLGTSPLIGRTFSEEEDRRSAPLVVISWGLWQRRFGGDPSIAGRKIVLNGEPWMVVGVMPRGFSFPGRRVEAWVPAGFDAATLARRGSHFLQCFARLKPGVTPEQAQSEMTVIARRLEQRYPDTNTSVGAVVVPMRDQVAGESRMGLLVLFGASGFVLLIACANVANLLLARAAARQREIAVRTAIGAGRSVIIGQLITESLMLAGLGAVAGIGLARLAMIFLEKLVPTALAAGSLHIDVRMLVFTIVVTTATGIAFGLFPAFAAGRVDIQHALRQGGRTSAGGGALIREALVISQTALAVALLTGAGLMLKTLDHLQNTDLGIRTDHILTLTTVLTPDRYATHARQEGFVRSVVDSVKSLPGVVDAGYTSVLPLTATGNTNGYTVEGQPASADGGGQDALFRVVTPGFLAAMGAQVRAGRLLTDADNANTEPVILINETFASRHFGNAKAAVDKRISINALSTVRWLRIVGVVKEIRERGINIAFKPGVYMPLAQSDGYWPVPADLVIRTVGDPVTLARAVREAVWSVDRLQPISDIRTMTDVVDEALQRESQQATLLGGLACLALVLAATGIYGVISYAVSLQRREIGVRMALGATPANVVGMVLRKGLVLIGAGIVAGVAISMMGSRLLATMLHGVTPQDPGTLLTAVGALALVALAACAAPARSAAVLDPMAVLRED